MGEGGISRHEFWHEMKLWEIMRIRNGIQRRYRVIREESRMLAYIYTVAHISKESDKPKSAYNYLPFPWDPVISADWENKEYERAMEMLHAENAKNKKEQPE